MLAAHLPPEPAAIAFWTPQRGLLAIGGRVEVTRDGGRSFRLALRAERTRRRQRRAGSHGPCHRPPMRERTALELGAAWRR